MTTPVTENERYALLHELFDVLGGAIEQAKTDGSWSADEKSERVRKYSKAYGRQAREAQRRRRQKPLDGDSSA